MPWSKSDVDSHIKGLSDKQKEAWVSIANSVLADCNKNGGSDCEGKAVRIANSKCKLAHGEALVTDSFSDTKIRWRDIPTEETEDGLLVKGIPVFKAGVQKDKKYDEDFLDKKIIAQFDPEEDIPLQADHSDSYNSTLGWVKNLYRKGKMLFSDLLLVDDNAITRWKKGLMKKWSVSIHKETGKIQEISAVAFPYVKEAAIHGDVAEVSMARDYEVEEREVVPKPPKKEIIEIDTVAEREDAMKKETIKHEEKQKEEDPEEGQKEVVQITEEEIASMISDVTLIKWSTGIDISLESDGTKDGTELTIDGKKIKNPSDVMFSLYGDSVSLRYSVRKSDDNGITRTETFEYRNPTMYNGPTEARMSDDYELDEFAKWTQASKNDLPDSCFALIKHPVKDKAQDRALPYKDANGKLDPAHIRNALARINQVKGFSTEVIDRAKRLLIATAKKVGIKVNYEDNKMSDIKPTPEESVLLKEALERETKMSEDIKTRDEKITKISDELKIKDTEVKKFKVEKEVAELKAAGKILPAQEAKITEFMIKLDDTARADFVAVLKDGKNAVNLDESGAQKSEKEEAKLDLEKMSIEDIEAEIEKYAKKEGIPTEDARDIFYEKHTKKE